MLFRQILDEDLGCASYLLADGGVAAVIDPRWEVEAYLALAREHDLRIEHVLETHTHADHVSGRGRLVEATGATVRVSADAGATYEHEPLEPGDALELGDVRVVAVPTPGHRPEHLAFLVQDRSRGEEPWLLLTGDSLFVGDVARPDLAVEPEEGARELRRSLGRLLEHDDFVEVWPGHVGGSLCGGAGMSEKPGSTLGFERRFNPFVRLVDDEERFVSELTAALAPQPPNFERIVELNRGPLLRHAVPLEPLAPERVRDLLDEGALLLDARDPRAFDAAHVPGSVSVPATYSGIGTRAAWVVDPERDVMVVAAADEAAEPFVRTLEAVGFRRLRGHLAGGLPAWQRAGLDVASTPALDPEGLAERLRREEVVLLDVREDHEWDDGHVEGSLHVPWHELRDEPPADVRGRAKPLAVACAAGNRSAVAVSLLERAGVTGLLHVADGGVEDLERLGIELVRSDGRNRARAANGVA